MNELIGSSQISSLVYDNDDEAIRKLELSLDSLVGVVGFLNLEFYKLHSQLLSLYLINGESIVTAQLSRVISIDN